MSVQSTQPGGKFCLQNRYNQDDSQTSFSVQFLCLPPPLWISSAAIAPAERTSTRRRDSGL
jgi:hypothetical protein